MRDGVKLACRNAQRAAIPNPCSPPSRRAPRATTQSRLVGLKPGLATERGTNLPSRNSLWKAWEGWGTRRLAACVNLQPGPLQRPGRAHQPCASAKLRLGRIFEEVSLDSESATLYKIGKDAAHLSARSTNGHVQIDCTRYK